MFGTHFIRRGVIAALVAVVLSAVAVVIARRVPTAPPAPPSYENDSAWLCRPGRKDACSATTTATVFEPDGNKRRVTYAPAAQTNLDCFYLYPTVSRVRAAYSPIAATSEEDDVARRQFARFASVCRPFAPLYRQVTNAGLPALFAGDPHVTLDVPLRDVLAAWKHYLAHDNNGRRIVLIGHSQGSRLLARLIAAEIDGRPIQAQLAVAIIPGAKIEVPVDRDLGGAFKHIPLCGAGTRTRCVIAYSSYPAEKEVPANARYGATGTPGMRNACVNPAQLADAPALAADIPLSRELRQQLGTDFATFPGEIGAACQNDKGRSVLAVAVSDANRIGEPTRALVERATQFQPRTGYHPLDLNLALGTLVELVRQMDGGGAP